jgi:hypothetical protein
MKYALKTTFFVHWLKPTELSKRFTGVGLWEISLVYKDLYFGSLDSPDQDHRCFTLAPTALFAPDCLHKQAAHSRVILPY